jgi:hypothetical protein
VFVSVAIRPKSFAPSASRSRTFDGSADGRARIRSTSPRISVSGSSFVNPARTSRSPRSAGSSYAYVFHSNGNPRSRKNANSAAITASGSSPSPRGVSTNPAPSGPSTYER